MTDNPKVIARRGKAAVEKRMNRLEALVIEYVPTASLHPNKWNPNRQTPRDFELLCRSMREDGFTQPIVVGKDDVIVDGEHRWRAAREIGLTEVPVVRVDMTAEQARIATLRHNRARGSEDFELGAQVLRDLRELGALGWAQDSLMIDDKELDRLLDDQDAASALAADEFSPAWVPTEATLGQEEEKTAGSSVSFTMGAASSMSAHNAALSAAGTDAERHKLEQAFRKETFKLTLHFRSQDAELVRRVLEPRPAERILQLCRAQLALADASKAVE